ncbi:CXXC-type zinc finger protein 1, variant 2 [Balamuthia mandrillaris]
MSSQCAVDGHLLVSINNNLDSTSPFLPSPHFRPLQQIHHPHPNTSSTAAMHAETFLAAANDSSNHNLNHSGDGGGGNTRSRTALPPRKRIKTGGLSSSGSPPASPPSSPPLASALSFSAGSNKKPIKASIEYLLSSNRDSDGLESPSFEDTSGKNPDNTAPSSSSRSSFSSSSSGYDQQLQNHPQQHTELPIAASGHLYSGRRLGHTKSPSLQASSPSHSTSPYRESPIKEEDLVQKSEDVARLLSQLPPRRAKMEQIATSSSSRSSGEEERWEDDPPEQIRRKRRTKTGDSPLVASVRNSEKRKKRIIYEEEEQYEEDESYRHAPSKIKQRLNRSNPDFQTLANRSAKTTPKSQHQTPHSASQQRRKVELTKPRNSARGRKKKIPSNEDLAQTTDSHTDAKATGRRDRKRRSASHREELDESPLESEEEEVEDAPQREEEEDGEEEEEEDANALYCICRRPYDADLFMIACDGCDEWYHGTCVNISEKEAKSLKTYLCPLCQKKKMKKERAAKERRQKKERRREIQQQQQLQLQQQRKQKKEPKSSSNSKSTRFLAQLTSAAKEEEVTSN